MLSTGLLLNLSAQPLLLLSEFGSELGAEIVSLKYLADLYLGLIERGALERLTLLSYLEVERANARSTVIVSFLEVLSTGC